MKCYWSDSGKPQNSSFKHISFAKCQTQHRLNKKYISTNHYMVIVKHIVGKRDKDWCSLAHSHVTSVPPSGFITIQCYTFKRFWQQEFLIIPFHALNKAVRP